MIRINNRLILVTILITLFIFTSCANSSAVSSSEVGDSDTPIFYVSANTGEILDDYPLSFTILCNFYSKADNSCLNVQVVDVNGSVVYEESKVFTSGEKYSYSILPEDCGFIRFDSDEYTMKVSSTYNSYIGSASIKCSHRPDNTIEPSSEDTWGSIDSINYSNSYFGIGYNSSEGSSVYGRNDFIYDEAGYKIDFYSVPSDGSCMLYVLVGHVYYNWELQTKDLEKYITFYDEPVVTEIIKINGIEYLKCSADEIVLYMTYKNTDIFVFVFEGEDVNSPAFEDEIFSRIIWFLSKIQYSFFRHNQRALIIGVLYELSMNIEPDYGNNVSKLLIF